MRTVSSFSLSFSCSKTARPSFPFPVTPHARLHSLGPPCRWEEVCVLALSPCSSESSSVTVRLDSAEWSTVRMRMRCTIARLRNGDDDEQADDAVIRAECDRPPNLSQLRSTQFFRHSPTPVGSQLLQHFPG